MSRIASTFQCLLERDEKALVTFITAGDPSVDATVPAMHKMVANGADIVELGVPFTDPEADGPAIQRSSERGLANGVTLRKTCELVASFRKSDADTPVVLMGYYNPIIAMGLANFAKLASDSGVDGLIVVNLPPESATDLTQALQHSNIDLILLVAPTTTSERIKVLAAHGQGFLYYVSIKGITGADHLDTVDVAKHVDLIRRESSLPVAVGFGIKSPESAQQIAKVADGVVVGSVLVDVMGSSQSLDSILDELGTVTHALKQGVLAGC